MEKIGSVAVFGGGIAGMQSSLDLAEMGFKVFLVENGPCIGGTMAQLDKTFPTNDCAMCIMSPKLVDVGRHSNVQIITNAELAGVEGTAGCFSIRLKMKPGYVDEEKCNGCGDCAEKCPVELPSVFDEGVGKRKAIYRPYPQAIPNVFSIDKRGVPPCREACPAHVNVQGYIALASAGEYRKAYELVRERHPLPAVCGRICHHPCEAACSRREIDEPVAINPIKRFVADWAHNQEPDGSPGSENKASPKNGKRAAVIGAGPAGLTCAKDLAEWGCMVTILEREDKPGGTLYAGIPGYRLDKEVLFKEAARIFGDPNIEIRYGVEVGRDVTLSTIKNQGYDAVFLATGATRSRALDVKGSEAEEVLCGLDFLRGVNTGAITELEGAVVIIGGGNVATDSARSALRLGAKQVTIVYRRTRKEMPAYRWEIDEALEEGVEVLNSWAPEEITAENGRVRSVRFVKCIGVFDLEGNFKTEFFGDETVTLDADCVIGATGQVPDETVLEGIAGVERGPGGVVKADPLTLRTDVEWLFAGGDVVRGPSSAVEAVAAGHEAAESIMRYLEGKDLRENRGDSPSGTIESAHERGTPGRMEEVRRELITGRRKRAPRRRMPVLPIEERVTGFREIELGLDEETVRAEAARCLNCGGCSECMVCVEACGKSAIDHRMGEREAVIEAGALIFATGHRRFDPSGLSEYGYGRYPNVVTSVEFERILSSSGPYRGHLLRPSDLKEPKKIAWVQCVGSREQRKTTQVYCSSVCCMYSIKEAMIAKEHAPGTECHVYAMDVRAFGKDFERYYERAQGEYGVQFRRARLSLIEEVPGSGDLIVKYVDEEEKVQEERYDMAVLAVGLVPAPMCRDLSALSDARLNSFGFIETGIFSGGKTSLEGVYVCGTAGGPRDIPETVATASAAVGDASAVLKEARHTLTREKTYPEERSVEEEEPRIGVFVCRCGINIGSVVDVGAVVEHARSLSGVVHAEENIYTCSRDTQDKIREVIGEKCINRIAIVSCTPRTHEPLFQETLRESGLNPFLMEFVAIREQCSWVHMRDKDRATGKAKELLTMGVARTRLLKPFQRASFPVVKRGLVVGGGVAGMNAALSFAAQGFETVLVEKEQELGGNLAHVYSTIEGDDTQAYLRDLVSKVRAQDAVQVMTGTEVVEVEGYVGNYRTTVRNRMLGTEAVVEHGAVIIATGAGERPTDEYLYGKSERIVTQRELEKMIAENRRFSTVAMIQCVGSRDERRPYCSRVCCLSALKNALKIKKTSPDAKLWVFYRDIRSYGFYEDYYRKAREMGVTFIRYDPQKKPSVSLDDSGTPVLGYHNLILGREMELKAELVALSVGIEPLDNKAVSNQFKIPLTKDGFFLEAHAKLRPIDCQTEGVYICGTAHSPMTIRESIAQAVGSAARAAVLLSKESIRSLGSTIQMRERICSGCGSCVSVCPYKAREIDEETGKARVIEVLCQGCGACSVVCPNGASEQTGYTKEQIYSMLEEAVF